MALRLVECFRHPSQSFRVPGSGWRLDGTKPTSLARSTTNVRMPGVDFGWRADGPAVLEQDVEGVALAVGEHFGGGHVGGVAGTALEVRDAGAGVWRR